MGRSEVELVQRICDAYARGDWAAAAEPLHDDIEWDTTTTGWWPVVRFRAYADREAALRAASA